MSTFLTPQPVLRPFPCRTRTWTPQPPSFHRTHFPNISNPKPFFRVVAKFGFLNSGQLPDLEKVEGTIRELFSRAEGLFYTVSDAAVANSDAVGSSSDTARLF